MSHILVLIRTTGTVKKTKRGGGGYSQFREIPMVWVSEYAWEKRYWLSEHTITYLYINQIETVAL